MKWKVFLFFGYIILSLILSGCATVTEKPATTKTSDAIPIRKVGSCGFDGGSIFTARGLHVAGGYAYVAHSNDGLRIVDVSDPSKPREVGFCVISTPPREAGTISTPAYGVDVVGGYAYVAAGLGGLRVIDVSDPSNPQEVGFCTFLASQGLAEGIHVAGNHAYVAGRSGLFVVDVSDPTKPRQVGFFDTVGVALGVYVAGEYAYVAAESGGLRIIDVSNVTKPKEVGFCKIPGGTARGVYTSGGYAYVAAGSRGLRVIQVSTPSRPRQVGAWDMPDGEVRGVYISGKYAYVIGTTAGLSVIDIRDPLKPYKAGDYASGNVDGIYIVGDYAYLTYGGLSILKLGGGS